MGPTNKASTSIYTGEILIETQYAYTIKNGSLDKLIRPVTLGGNSLDILSRINSVGESVEKFPTQCLKQNNKILIGAYSPQITTTPYYL